MLGLDGILFDPNSASPADKAGIRKFPATGDATTNEVGEFYQADPQMLYHKDQVVIEFRVSDESYYSNPATPTLPFSSFTVAKADSINDFATGQVNSIRSVDWQDNLPEVQYKWTYCSGAIVNLSQYLGLIYDQYVTTGDQAIAYTDQWGNFDTRKPPLAVVPGSQISNAGFDVYETPSNWGSLVGYDVSLNYHEATTTGKVAVHTTFDISFDRTIQMVLDSFRKYEENGKLIHHVQYNESIWIVNPNGTHIITSDEFRYNRIVFSTQDLGCTTDYRTETDLVRNYQWVLGESGKQLIPLLDGEGRETGAALFKERVTIEWVWQDHPNPVLITSDDHTIVNQQGSLFTVTAAVLVPLFQDPYQDQAPSPPDKQVFTLTPAPTQAPRTPPAIKDADHGYAFVKLIDSGDFQVQIEADGSTPIS